MGGIGGNADVGGVGGLEYGIGRGVTRAAGRAGGAIASATTKREAGQESQSREQVPSAHRVDSGGQGLEWLRLHQTDAREVLVFSHQSGAAGRRGSREARSAEQLTI